MPIVKIQYFQNKKISNKTIIIQKLKCVDCNSNFKIMNLGRNQLLGWVNQAVQCQYSTIQMLSDGVAFCQLIDAIHPGSINISRLNLLTRYPDDCLRNLRLLQSGLKKLRINQPASFQKISQGKFQDNINFLQWIYSYCTKYGSQSIHLYQGYNRRLQILQKQGKSFQQINPHLVPTKAYIEQQNDEQYIGSYGYQNSEQMNAQDFIQNKKQQIVYKLNQLKQDSMTMEGQLKTQMQTNWKLMHNIQRSIQERNTLYSLLKQIQTIVQQSDNSAIGNNLLSIINETPQDFS